MSFFSTYPYFDCCKATSKSYYHFENWDKNLKKTFLHLRCSNVLLHLKYKLPLCKPEIEFKNLMGAKAPATDHRAFFSTSLTIFKDIMESYRSKDYWTNASTLYGREKKGKVVIRKFSLSMRCAIS